MKAILGKNFSFRPIFRGGGEQGRGLALTDMGKEDQRQKVLRAKEKEKRLAEPRLGGTKSREKKN